MDRYRVVWEAWADNERRALATADIFNRLYLLHGILKREDEQFELAIADGHLVWRRSDGGIRHPLISKIVRLEFDPTVPEFTIVDTDCSTEFYAGLFRNLQDVDGKIIAEVKNEAEALDLHPLELTLTDGLLKSTVVRLS